MHIEQRVLYDCGPLKTLFKEFPYFPKMVGRMNSATVGQVSLW